MPSTALLDRALDDGSSLTQEELSQIASLLETKLDEFGIEASVESVLPGPVVTRFEIQPAPGTKASKITNIAQDIARSLSVSSVRVEKGVIINTASIAGYEGQVGQSAYAASKAGVIGMTLTAARDLARHSIRVCTIAPGIFDTPLMSLARDENKEALLKETQFPHRFGNPNEYAQLAEHIINNTYLNGETIRLDSAMRMGPK